MYKNQLLESYPIEQKMGILYFCTKTEGIGGILRSAPKDFKVEEILPNGRIVKLDDKDFSFGENEPGLYTEFALIKKNIESHKAILRITHALGKDVDDLKIAGTKDKVAHTAQRATIWRTPPEELLRLQLKGISIQAPRTTIYQTHLGDLYGNHFTICIREIKLEKNELTNRINKLKNEWYEFGGLGNFFGHQRFGTRRPISHKVGRELIKGNIREAVMFYLIETTEDELESTKAARKILLDTNDPKEAYDAFSHEMTFERMILHYLVKNPTDFYGAFMQLPKNLQRLFIHSYQSYIWNLVLSNRIALFGNLNQQPDDLIENDEIVLPIIGTKTKLMDSYIFDIIKEQLERDEIKLTDFYMKKFPYLKFAGSNRKMTIIPQNFAYTVRGTSDEGNSVNLEFSLHSGSYATIVLREFMKVSPLKY